MLLVESVCCTRSLFLSAIKGPHCVDCHTLACTTEQAASTQITTMLSIRSHAHVHVLSTVSCDPHCCLCKPQLSPTQCLQGQQARPAPGGKLAETSAQTPSRRPHSGAPLAQRLPGRLLFPHLLKRAGCMQGCGIPRAASRRCCTLSAGRPPQVHGRCAALSWRRGTG
jgi:hypothetical protein